MGAPSRIVVIGAGIGGVRAVEALRAGGYSGSLTVIDADAELPYDRPPLSKEFLTGVLDEDDLRVWSLDHVAELEVDLRLATEAIGINATRKRITVRNGCSVEDLAYDRLVLAFGVAARRSHNISGLDGVYTLRSLADARRLRDRLRSAPGPVVVVGGGFIGGEVASSVVEYGLDVTIIEANAHLLPKALNGDLVRPLERLHQHRGVRVAYGTRVAAIKGVGTVECVELADGRRLPAAVVVEGLGCIPETGWLSPSGIARVDGIEVDAQLKTSADDIYAIGDVARWPDSRTGLIARVEHWENARKQGTHVAQSILGANTPFQEVPYVWTDQCGGKLQIAGVTHGDEVRFLHGDADASVYVAIVRRGDDLAGVIAFGPIGPAREFKLLRRALVNRATWESVVGNDITAPPAAS